MAGIGAAAAIITAAVSFWPTLGWVTPNQHDEDFETTKGEVAEFRDEYRCDKTKAELLDRLAQQRAGDDSVEITERIRELRERLVTLKCSRFEN